MTPQQLRNKIKKLKSTGPVTIRLERELASIEMWKSEEEWYDDQREHWLGWLSEYEGPGFYDRKGGVGRDARYSYNHIMCPPMLLWLGEGAGIPKSTVLSAMKAALSAKKAFPSQCKAIRDIVTWEMIDTALKSK